ncbi:mCG146020, partial [Mus musculus]
QIGSRDLLLTHFHWEARALAPARILPRVHVPSCAWGGAEWEDVSEANSSQLQNQSVKEDRILVIWSHSQRRRTFHSPCPWSVCSRGSHTHTAADRRAEDGCVLAGFVCQLDTGWSYHRERSFRNIKLAVCM